MARTQTSVELNNFVAGLITEASPLTFPANASLDERNFVLNRDGSRSRRLGMDFEAEASILSTTVVPAVGLDPAFSSERWRNAGGFPSKTIVVVQVGNELKFFDNDSIALSSGLIYTYVYPTSAAYSQFSFAVVDGVLVVVNGQKEIDVYSYDGTSITRSQKTLYVRDLFGVTDIVSGVNLRDGTNVSIRPSSLTPAHIYNLRNQTWAIERVFWSGNDTAIGDPIAMFRDDITNTTDLFPSNGDSVNSAIYANTASNSNKSLRRFNAGDLTGNPPGTFTAPQGYFIIDALSRGQSRMQEVYKASVKYPRTSYGVSSLPQDYTPGGATVVAEYSGRVFYAGFSGQVVGGDDNSPRLSSYILFSQLVQDTSDIGSCYQEADPTDVDNSDLVDTDGGFIRIEGAYDILGMKNVGSGLAVIARNGVWLVQGGSDYGFSATNYKTVKISTKGCIGAGTIVTVDNSFLFWGDDGIYNVATNQFGDFVASNITEKTIQKYYTSIDPTDAASAQGTYDLYEKKAKWVFGNRLSSSSDTTELVLDLTLGAFYPHVIPGLSGSKLPLVVKGFVTEPFKNVVNDNDVFVNGDQVLVGVSNVIINANTQVDSVREVKYIAITSIQPTISFTFSSYTQPNHMDWVSVNGVGSDAPAYILTGALSAGDYQKKKNIPYVIFHLKKTEDGFIEDSSGDYVPTNQSSCLVQAQWDWTNSPVSNKWSREFQAYRFRRALQVTDSSDNFNNGYYVVETKSKLRGNGKVVSFLIQSEPGKHMELLGWSLTMQANNNV